MLRIHCLVLKADLQVNGRYMKMQNALIGTTVFNDDSMTISSISKELFGSYLFQLSWNDNSNSSISILCDKDCVVIVALWDHGNRQDNLISLLQLESWMLRKEQKIKWIKNGGYGVKKTYYHKSSKLTIAFRSANQKMIYHFLYLCFKVKKLLS